MVVQVSRLSDGTRKVVSLAEITGMEGEVVTMQDIFVYRKRGVRESGEVLGEFIPTGIRPKFAERLAVTGIQLAGINVRSSQELLRIRDGPFTRTPNFCGRLRDCPLALDAGERRGSAEHVVRRRMSAVRKADNRTAEASPDLFLIRDEMLSSVPLLHRIMTQFSWSARLQQTIEQAGMTIKPAKVLLISGVLGFATFLIAGELFPRSLARGDLLGLLAAHSSLTR